MKVVVTGAAGFIGSNLVRKLLADRSLEVLGIDSFTDYYSVENKRRNLADINSDRFTLLDEDLVSMDLEAALRDAVAVFHQAGQPGVRNSWGSEFDIYTRQNVDATQRLLEAAKSVSSLEAFVYASSSSVYGDAERYPTTESDLPQPKSPYGVTKLAAEHLVTLYARNFGVPTVSLRYFTVYGPGQRPDMAFHKFIRAAIENSSIDVYGDGNQVREFSHVNDIVEANIAAWNRRPSPGSVINLSGGTSISVNETLNIIGELAGRRLDVRYSDMALGDVYRTGGSTALAQATLGWSPKMSIEDGLKSEFNWLAGALKTRIMLRPGADNVKETTSTESPGLGADVVAAKLIGANYQATGHIVFVVNTDRFFLTHRSSWAVALKAAGARVTLISEDTGYSQRVRELGIEFVRAPFGRESIRPLHTLKAAATVFSFLLQNRPDTVFLVATAAYTLGWPAAVILRRTQFVRVIAGAGRALARETKSVTASGVQAALRFTGRLSNVSTIFQTPDDAARFFTNGWANALRSTTIPGTGIDVEVWKASEYPDPTKHGIVVLFASRLFREKGIYEFVELARKFRDSETRFMVVGSPDTGVESSISTEVLDAWIAEGLIDYLGEVDDMISVYRRADILVFPSQHPEGTPRVLIEAAACGVMLVASNQPGCKVIVRDGETGRLFDPKEMTSIEATFDSVLRDGEGRSRMAAAARDLIIDQYSLDTTLERIHDFIGVTRAGKDSSGGIGEAAA